jgi:protein TonB
MPLPDMKSSSVANGSEPSLLVAPRRPDSQSPAPPMGGKVVQGRLLKSVPPQYPDVARQRHLEGDVMVRADVDARGNVVQVTALGGPDLLRSAAVTAVKQWKYSPALLNGVPVAMQVQVTVRFRSNH